MDESGAIAGLERTEERLRDYAAERGLTVRPELIWPGMPLPSEQRGPIRHACWSVVRAAPRRRRRAAPPPGRLRQDVRDQGRDAAHDHGLPDPRVGRLPADALGSRRGAGAGALLLGRRPAAARGRRRLRVGRARPPLHRRGRQGPGSRLAAPALPAELHRLARLQHPGRLRLPPRRRASSPASARSTGASTAPTARSTTSTSTCSPAPAAGRRAGSATRCSRRPTSRGAGPRPTAPRRTRRGREAASTGGCSGW